MKKIQTSPEIELALLHKEMINSTGRHWAALEIIQFDNQRICRLDIGNILSGGFKERKIETRNYQMSINGEPVYTTVAHR